MAKYCFICGNDWCLNLTDNPMNPEDNICDNCQDLKPEEKCSACRNEDQVTRKNDRQEFMYILIFIVLLIIAFFSLNIFDVNHCLESLGHCYAN